MKPLISKLVLILSMVFFIGVNTSCIVDQLDCSDAQVEIINNTDFYVYYSDDPNDPWCYPDMWLNPGESVVLYYGEVHTTSDNPVFVNFFYRFHGPGDYATALDIEIEHCNNVVYLR